MKRKIVLSLLALFFVFATGAATAIFYITNTTQNLNRLIQLHQIEHLRQNLIISIQTAQSDLYTLNTALGSKLDSIVSHMSTLKETAGECSGCHHSPALVERLTRVQSLILDYETSLSSYITALATTNRLEKIKFEAAATGNEILMMTEDMSIQASRKLESMTSAAMKKINSARTVLYITIFLTCIAGMIIAVHLKTSITTPVGKLVDATRAITSGDLGYTIPYTDKTEFGELASRFNTMSSALKSGYETLEKEIADRMRTEAALVKSEQFLSTVFNSILDPFCIIDSTFTIVKVNDAYAQLKNRRAEDLIGKTCFETLLNREIICDDCVVQRTFFLSEAASKRKLISSPDGTKTWIEIYTYPIMDQQGVVTHVIEYTRDITEQKQTEEALRESQDRYALAARGANDGLWDWDLNMNSIYFSPRWKSMLGYDEKDIGKTLEDWLSRIHPDDRKQVEAKINAHIEGHIPNFESEHRIMSKGGTYFWVLSRGLAVRDGSGKAYRMAGSQTDITSRKLAEEQLLHDAFHDALTNLPNRALFLDRLSHAIQRSQRLKTALYAVLFLDMDRFKVVNDTLGHMIGDEFLVAVSQRLVNCLRPGDTVARLGGDEFAVLLENISDTGDAIRVAERIQTELQVPFSISGHEVFTTASIGISLGVQSHIDPEEILREADIAMYQAKAKGKACFEIFDISMHANVLERLQLEADLRQAVERKQFVLHYQPIVDLKNERIIGFEALVRWNHPKRGIIYPLDFIPLAEETGMIIPIGQWILRESCRQLKEWQKIYPSDPPLKMSVNISGRQFSHPDLTSQIAQALTEMEIDAGCLVLEITESIIMDKADIAAKAVSQLRKMGIQIHIDDFGTGYSSLSYINHFPVNALKIDRSFINKMSTNEETYEIIKAIISLAHNLSLDVVAEGIELNDQLVRMRELKCEYAQGYLFSRPKESEGINLCMQGGRVVVGS